MNEITCEIDHLKTEKHKEASKFIKKSFKEKNYDASKVRLESLNEEISKKEKIIAKLQSEIEDKSSSVNDKTTNYKFEETSLKQRFDTLK